MAGSGMERRRLVVVRPLGVRVIAGVARMVGGFCPGVRPDGASQVSTMLALGSTVVRTPTEAAWDSPGPGPSRPGWGVPFPSRATAVYG